MKKRENNSSFRSNKKNIRKNKNAHIFKNIFERGERVVMQK